MSRRLVLATLLAVVALGAWAALRPPTQLEARFAPSDCRRIAGALSGPEDLARALGGGVVVSSHDRRAAFRAAAAGLRPPDGGLYLLRPADGEEARALIEAAAFDGGFRPHGIAARGRRLAAVNRRYDPTPTGWRRRTTIEMFEWTTDGALRHLRTVDADLCAANDLAFRGDSGLFVTLDRGDCQGSIRETLWSGGGAVVAVDLDGQDRIETVRAGLAFANGVFFDPQSRAWPDGAVAETRGNRLSRLQDATAAALPGGPDNLTQDGEGLVTALHPALIRLALYRNGWLKTAPSRIVRIGADGATEILFDDPLGRTYSGATVGMMIGDALLIGGALETGLLLCERGV